MMLQTDEFTPRYAKVTDHLVRALSQMKIGDRIVAERVLAQQLRVSRLTLRRAMDDLRRQGIIESDGARGSFLKRRVNPQWFQSSRMRYGRQAAEAMRLVQVVAPNLAFHQCVAIAQGIKEAARKAGVQTQIYDAHGGFDSDLEAIRRLPHSAARGAVILSQHHQRFAEVLYELKAADYPFVLVDEALRDINVPSVVADNYQGGRLVGEKLLELGHRKIGFIGNFFADTARARLEGFRDAIADAGLPFDRSLVEELRVNPEDDWSQAVSGAVRKILGGPGESGPTAIFFFNDLVVPDGYRAIRAMGLRIPEDISVVGFDGDPLGRLLTPTLASVRQPSRKMGLVAMEMLLALMDGDPMAGWPGMETGVVNRAAGTAIAVVSRAARMPVAVRDGSEENTLGDPETRRHGDTEAGRRVAPMETDAPIAAANKTQGHDSAWHRVLPVTWQDGGSIGPAPGATGNSTTKDTKATDSAREDAKNAKRCPAANVEMAGV